MADLFILWNCMCIYFVQNGVKNKCYFLSSFSCVFFINKNRVNQENTTLLSLDEVDDQNKYCKHLSVINQLLQRVNYYKEFKQCCKDKNLCDLNHTESHDKGKSHCFQWCLFTSMWVSTEWFWKRFLYYPCAILVRFWPFIIYKPH